MQYNTTKTLILSIIIAFFAFANISANADNPQRTKERMDMVKKIKMLEVLNLDSAKSEKFLLKLSEFERKMEDNRKSFRKLNDVLNEKLSSNTDSKRLAQLVDSLLSLQEEFNKIVCDKNKAIKPILSEIEFAKYINFENMFFREFFDSYMSGKHKDKATHLKSSKK